MNKGSGNAVAPTSTVFQNKLNSSPRIAQVAVKTDRWTAADIPDRAAGPSLSPGPTVVLAT